MKKVLKITLIVIGSLFGLLLLIGIFAPEPTEEEKAARAAREAASDSIKLAKQEEKARLKLAKQAKKDSIQLVNMQELRIRDSIRREEEALREREELLAKKLNDLEINAKVKVKRFLKNNLNDPGSYDSSDWSDVVKISDETYAIRHAYRARNGFGALIKQNTVFYIDIDGNVIDTKPFQQ
jgi:gas vesicle protein